MEWKSLIEMSGNSFSKNLLYLRTLSSFPEIQDNTVSSLTVNFEKFKSEFFSNVECTECVLLPCLFNN